MGVNPESVDKIIKDFTTAINNANKINPPMYLTPEVIVFAKLKQYMKLSENPVLQ